MSDVASELSGRLESAIRAWVLASPEHRALASVLGELLIASSMDDAERARVGVHEAPGDRLPERAAEPSPPRESDMARAKADDAETRRGRVAEDVPALRGPRAVVPLRLGGDAQLIEVRGNADAVLAAGAAAPPSSTGAALPSGAPDLPDLERLAQRCELKASAALLSLETPPERRDSSWWERSGELQRRASVLGSRGLWVLEHGAEEEREAISTLERTLFNTAHAARVVQASRQVVEGSRLVEPGSQEEVQVLTLFAQAQSALRVAAEALGAKDDDQHQAFSWLRQVTHHERVFVPRHMQLGDPGDPSLAEELSAVLREWDDRLRARKESRTAGKAARNKLRYHAKRLREHPDGGEGSDWSIVESCARALADRGETRGTLRSLLAELIASPNWSHAPEGLIALLDEAIARGVEEPAREKSALVQRVEGWLRGGRMVVVGGERRPDAIERLRDAFSLGEVEWVSLSEHGSSAPMRPAIVHHRTMLVVVLVKLTGHQHADDARAWSRDAGKPIVMVTGGYNPESLAAAIVEQCGERLVSGAAK
jgi:hypothetical protein